MFYPNPVTKQAAAVCRLESFWCIKSVQTAICPDWVTGLQRLLQLSQSQPHGVNCSKPIEIISSVLVGVTKQPELIAGKAPSIE